jgi:arylsulfatase A-like enzyme
VDHLNAQASMMAAHSSYVTRLLDTLKEEKIAENTLVVWMSHSGEISWAMVHWLMVFDKDTPKNS